MASDEKRFSLNLNHIFVTIICLAVSFGIAWGTITTRQTGQQKEIDKKASQEAFDMHQEQQREQFVDIKKDLEKLLEK